jgi:chemotaxis family two-component system response regulator Rcp1
MGSSEELVDAGMPIEVLLVEDSLGDVRLLQEAFRDANREIQLHVASDGLEALAFLDALGRACACTAPRPDPARPESAQDGWPRGAGAHQAGQPLLRAIPTVILTTSDAETDIVKSYQLHANCYLRKPVELDKFEDAGEEHQ